MKTVLVTDIARVTYEANRAHCASIGDNSFQKWEVAPDWQRKTNIDGVRAVSPGALARGKDAGAVRVA